MKNQHTGTPTHSRTHTRAPARTHAHANTLHIDPRTIIHANPHTHTHQNLQGREAAGNGPPNILGGGMLLSLSLNVSQKYLTKYKFIVFDCVSTVHVSLLCL